MFRSGSDFVALKTVNVVPRMVRTIILQPRLMKRRNTLATRTRNLMRYSNPGKHPDKSTNTLAFTYQVSLVFLFRNLFLLLHEKFLSKRWTQRIQSPAWCSWNLESALLVIGWDIVMRGMLSRVTRSYISEAEVRHVRGRLRIAGRVGKRRLSAVSGTRRGVNHGCFCEASCSTTLQRGTRPLGRAPFLCSHSRL